MVPSIDPKTLSQTVASLCIHHLKCILSLAQYGELKPLLVACSYMRAAGRDFLVRHKAEH